MEEKRDILLIRPQGEVKDLFLDFGWSCGMANPGIRIGFKKYQNRFEQREGILTKEQVEKMIDYLQKYVNKCKDKKNLETDNE